LQYHGIVVQTVSGKKHDLILVPVVLLKMKLRICGKRYRDIDNFSTDDCLKAFMDPHFLGFMKSYINSNM
jgi:hypothetical protein